MCRRRVKTIAQTCRDLAVAALALLALATACRGADLGALVRSRLQSPSERVVAEGDRLLAAGQPQEALLAYREAVRRDERNVVALAKLAEAQARQGRARTAQRYWERAVALSPELTPGPAMAALTPGPRPDTPLALRWQMLVADDMPAGMALADGVLYVAFDGGDVVALAADGGAGRGGMTIWRTQLATRLIAPPAIVSGLVLLGGEDGVLYALDRRDGSRRWDYATGGAIYATPAVAGGLVYCPSHDGTLYALSLADGSLVWRFATGGWLHSAPTVAEGVVYFGSGNTRVYALDAATGAPVWEAGIPTLDVVESSPAVADGRVLVGSGDSRLYCLAAASGGCYWFYSVSDAIVARPLVSGDTVYVAAMDGTLAALDLLSGAERWRVRLATPLLMPPVAMGEWLLVVASADPHLYALMAADGELVWRMDTGDWLAMEPLLDEGALYLLGKDGTVLAFAAP